MAQEKILVVDDEETIRLTVSTALRRNGFETTTAQDANEALSLLDQTKFDLAILDLKLPGSMDGIGLLTEIRARSPETIVMMISAHATLDSAIVALRNGAFDYLLKPFTMEQVVDRVKQAVGKRSEIAQPASENLPGIQINHLQRSVLHNGNAVSLSVTEFDILAYLIDHSDQIVSSSELMHAVAGYNLVEQEARTIVRVHVQRIRQKLGDDPENPRHIQNVRSKGYRFVG
jgi:DNA-binding response OmpR family regulator